MYNRKAMRLECTDVNKAIDLEGQKKGQGTKIHMWSTHGGISQKWHLVRRVFITNLATGKMMDVAGCSKSNNTKVHLWVSNQGAAQIWGWFQTGSNGEGYLEYIHGGAQYLTLKDSKSLVIHDRKNSDSLNDQQIFKLTDKGQIMHV